MGGTEVLFPSLTGAGVLIMEGTGVPTLVDTAGSLLAAKYVSFVTLC